MNKDTFKNLALLSVGAVLMFGFYDLKGTLVRESPRLELAEFEVTDGTADRISETAKSRTGTVDLLLNCEGTCYWRLHDQDWDGNVDADSTSATITAAMGTKQINNIPWNWVIESDNGDLHVKVLEGGHR